MIYEKKPSWKGLTKERQHKAQEALKQLVSFFEGGDRPQDLGLKKLKNPFWEIRTDLKDRIIFTFEKNRVSFIIIGNHDQIRRLLKR